MAEPYLSHVCKNLFSFWGDVHSSRDPNPQCVCAFSAGPHIAGVPLRGDALTRWGLGAAQATKREPLGTGLVPHKTGTFRHSCEGLVRWWQLNGRKVPTRAPPHGHLGHGPPARRAVRNELLSFCDSHLGGRRQGLVCGGGHAACHPWLPWRQAEAGCTGVHRCVSLVPLPLLFGQLPRTHVLCGKEELRVTERLRLRGLPGGARPPLPQARGSCKPTTAQ